MAANKVWINHPWVRFLQHLAFWTLSFFVFLQLFKTSRRLENIDYTYAALFHITVIPVVYINLEFLLPRVRKGNTKWWYAPVLLSIIIFFAWINYGFFENWSNLV